MDAAASPMDGGGIETGAMDVPWHRSRQALLPGLLSIATACYFLAVLISRTTDAPLNRSVGAVFVAINLSAAVMGLRRLAWLRHDAASPLRHMTFSICVALLLDCIGSAVWLGYNVLGDAIPYPSSADVFYLASDLVWLGAIGLLFWALDTNIRDELGPFVDILAVTWSLTIVVISLVGVSAATAGGLLKLVLDIVYPFLSALSCALLGALVFGPQLRRLGSPWRWFLLLLYAAWVLTFLSDLGFSITSSLGRNSGTFQYFYFDGGPTDAAVAASDLLVCWALAFLPLAHELSPGQESQGPADFIAGRPVDT